jgi:DNA-binding NarL/FixJ family response regulator
MPKILIADDNEQIRKLLSIALAQDGNWNVCGEAANGRQAVLLAHKLKPDLIILDIAMPMLDGFRATAEILKTSPAVPIILYTLHRNDQIDLEGKKAGARMVLSKTEPVETLLESVRELLTPSPAPGIPAQETIALSFEDSNEPTGPPMVDGPKNLNGTPETSEGS